MKPFNLEHAKAGAPLQLADGRKAEILKFGIKASVITYNNVGIVTELDGHQWITQWNDSGECQTGTSYRLHMAQLGQCEGRDVYVGDKLMHKEMASYIIATTPNDFSAWVWPMPPKAYPVTRMSTEQIAAAFDRTYGQANPAIQTANAAIRHGIDNGYLVDPAELDRLSVGLGDISADTPAEFITQVCKKYAAIVDDGNEWVEKCREANANVAKQNKIITDMAAANSKLIEAQRKADERGQFLALIAKHVGMSEGYAYVDVPFNVKTLLYAKQTEINERNNILIEIAKGCNLTEDSGHWLFAQVPAAVRLREVAIARHFYTKGRDDLMGAHAIVVPPTAPLSAERVTSELTKVQ